MLDLASHIIKTKSGKFEPREFDDRYDQAVAELVKAKIEGREIPPPKRPKETKVTTFSTPSARAPSRPARAGRPRPAKKTALLAPAQQAKPARPRKAG